jgi:hypothetical protein
VQDEIGRLKAGISGVEFAEDNLHRREVGMKEAQRELEEKFNGTCPLCGAEMGD